MSEPMSDEELVALSVEYGDDMSADDVVTRFKLLRSRLEAAEAVCDIASDYLQCIPTAAGYDDFGRTLEAWQGLLPKPEPEL